MLLGMCFSFSCLRVTSPRACHGGGCARRRVRDERHGELLEVRFAVVAGEDARHLERLDRARVAYVAAPSHALPGIRRPPLASVGSAGKSTGSADASVED